MFILGIETSCDDTCAAVLKDSQILSNVISSQIDLHKAWGGVVPDIAKRAHQERINPVIETALKRAKLTIKDIDLIAVTKGPGLAIALGVGVKAAVSLAVKYHKKIVAVNHIEGHLMANFLTNSQGKPLRPFVFPSLTLTVSGGHTKIVLIKKIGDYEVIGETLDDAAGEALDKSAKLLGLGYPGGPVIERLSLKGDSTFLKLPTPIADKKILDYSFSGLKTAFYYQIKDWPKVKINKHLADLAASFQSAVFATLIRKFSLAVEKYHPACLMLSGGVAANLTLRTKMRHLAKTYKLPLYLPFKKELNTDNAAMIALAGFYQAKRGDYANPNILDIDSRAEL
ncbi:MAG: putative tRNA threonylcarbamoyladenosine biosynthesis protein Gcp [Candidatus Shapirobacteria bacterium GW2011_GWE1_38_10]|uniref:tRNA N6-adenosine threonylcarbamoyltransferase n=1 Tax=Candidatus Shapirobacteria bacterium GW2011_GWE1_38_10 TaxID=1618488 RepID=A0A0G0I3K1_9BACT|nr:MAG: putative tRNA threonylcarbamoyladenosine biosynthesis protein Gcp [Candidatus Shapirobacteria bacterium GW2011_GWF2_37_20]KKQ49918.1 MAG: putative tRNA threonylcarbamoyladenosine biosynthesis protein Gcp [Candidatus Shapirobacteria bacterium GW2011_GWE1_38_10]KKQ64346.1 MAG: putative tRNA threonylcarbamoyladenosine biosynthesis protein Gcp [Candidatus Shapirobacteria bacterium GW2011_GWF1_38_23]HBP51538.1 tRNA (adenosine(37)-N6)-threonylcarbamoyltransferase complex transferase subunit Ts